MSPPVFENRPPEFVENKLEPEVFEENKEFPFVFKPNPPCEELPNSEIFPGLLKIDAVEAFMILLSSLPYWLPFFFYEDEAIYCLSFRRFSSNFFTPLLFTESVYVDWLEKGLAKRDCAFENSPEVLFWNRPVVLKRLLNNGKFTIEFYFPQSLVEVLSDLTPIF